MTPPDPAASAAPPRPALPPGVPDRIALPAGMIAVVRSLDPKRTPEIVVFPPKDKPLPMAVAEIMALPEMRRWRGQLLGVWVAAGGDRAVLEPGAQAALAEAEALAGPTPSAASPAPPPPSATEPKAASATKLAAPKPAPKVPVKTAPAPAAGKPSRLRPPKTKG